MFFRWVQPLTGVLKTVRAWLCVPGGSEHYVEVILGRLRIDSRRTAPAVALVVAVSFTASGCASVRQQASDQLDAVRSATAGVALAVGEQHDGRSIAALSGTVIDDALTELESAESAVTEMSTAGAKEAEERDTALAEIRDATDDVLAARSAVDDAGDIAAAESALKNRVNDLEHAIAELKG